MLIRLFHKGEKKMIRRTISFEDARIIFRNFEGKPGRFNPEGNRNFCILLPPDVANELKDEGWNIKFLAPRDEGDEPQAYIQVGVSFDPIPCKIVMITSNGSTELDEANVKILDWADIQTVDIVIRPYNWEVNGKTGVKAYLKKMFVTIEEDEFEKKYKLVPPKFIEPEDGD